MFGAFDFFKIRIPGASVSKKPSLAFLLATPLLIMTAFSAWIAVLTLAIKAVLLAVLAVVISVTETSLSSIGSTLTLHSRS
jgi:hypothetical protein